jgi:hypothetical protein
MAPSSPGIRASINPGTIHHRKEAATPTETS